MMLNGALSGKSKTKLMYVSVSKMSRFTYPMIVVSTTSAFIGLITENSTVKTMICKALTVPQSSYRTEERKNAAIKLDTMKDAMTI